MPRIKKDKEFVIPEHIITKINLFHDTLLTIKSCGGYKVGDKYYYGGAEGIVYGFVNLGDFSRKNRIFVLASFGLGGGMYGDGFYVYEVKG